MYGEETELENQTVKSDVDGKENSKGEAKMNKCKKCICVFLVCLMTLSTSAFAQEPVKQAFDTVFNPITTMKEIRQHIACHLTMEIRKLDMYL